MTASKRRLRPTTKVAPCSRIFLQVALWAVLMPPVGAEHPCSSPLVLDLDGDGVATTGLERPVAFDINGDGAEDQIGWVFAEGADAFLWLDLNGNGLVDHGGELFGTSTRLPPGGFARNGFEALAVYDRRDFGGNEDGRISSHDVIWESLGLWKDRNHDGLSQPTELSDLRASPVESIGLAYIGLRRGEGLDGHGNFHAYRGTFIARIDSLGTTFQRRLVIDDVIFVLTHDHSHPREKGD